jgi:SpoVK/Ycf46/Vps4 family AAA+-type ATPase
MSTTAKLHQLLTARHPCVFISTSEEPHALEIIRSAAVERGCDCRQWSVTRGLSDAMLAGAQALADTMHPAGALAMLTTIARRGGMYVFIDLLAHLKDERTLRCAREAILHCRSVGATLVLVDYESNPPPAIAPLVTHLEIPLPDEKELEQIVRSTLRELNDEMRISVSISRKGLDTVVRNLSGLSRQQARQVIMDAVCEDRRFDESDLNHILAHKRRLMGGDGLLEYIEAPTDLDEIGGLTKLKAWLQERSRALSSEAQDYGISPPRGVFMLGVQGAGKSLAAKAVATAWGRPLLRLDPGVLFDRYIGESERRLRTCLRQAELMAPVVLWIDEIEKGFASAASQSVDGGLSKRMFGTLLTWMQEHDAPVFLIATANDIEALPPELLRKGRFDEIFFVDLPTREARRQIFAIHLKRRKRNPEDYDLDQLADVSEGYSGAEIEQAVVSGLHRAFADGRPLEMAHLLDALRTSPPLSVTMAEKVEALRRWSRGRCVPAD